VLTDFQQSKAHIKSRNDSFTYELSDSLLCELSNDVQQVLTWPYQIDEKCFNLTSVKVPKCQTSAFFKKENPHLNLLEIWATYKLHDRQYRDTKDSHVWSASGIATEEFPFR
jgi:hypothetical protein